jgi:CheY-like chemotaxis protein
MLDSKPILLVEDDCVDVMAVQRVLKDLDVCNELVYAANGEEALAYLRDKDHELPCVIFLDLNMPKMNGLEFLRALRAEERLKDIPAVVVSTSAEKQDVARSLDLGAAAYIVKCFSYHEFRERMKVVQPYFVAARPVEHLEPSPLVK